MAPYRFDDVVANRFAPSIAELIARRGDIAARAAETAGAAQARAAAQSGDIWARTVGNIGQTLAAIPGQMQAAKDAQAERAFRQMQIDDVTARRASEQASAATLSEALPKGRIAALKSLEGQPELYAKAQQHFDAIDTNYKRLMGSVAAGVREFGDSPEAALTALDDLEAQGFDAKKLTPLRMAIAERPERIGQLVDGLLEQSPDEAHRALVKKAPKPAEPFTLSEGQIRYDADGNPIAYGADKPAPAEKLHPVTVPGPDGKPMTKMFTEAQLQAGVPTYQAPREPKDEPLVAIMGPDGQSVLVPRSQAIGKRPANQREQGRPVTSGDAGRIADLDTSLNDLTTLRDAVKEPGTIAKIESKLPTWVSEITGGWSDDAKEQNAVIARVRQVIGKALEGGVLRKEDEEKYKAILPVIGDSKAVALSKIEGLEKALRQRRSTLLDSLADANYDVSRYQSRDVVKAAQQPEVGPKTPPGPPQLTPGLKALKDR